LTLGGVIVVVGGDPRPLVLIDCSFGILLIVVLVLLIGEYYFTLS